MSSTPIRIDGIGSRKSGADSSTFGALGISTVNFAKPKNFVRLYATATITKGQAVAIDMSVTTHGVGNHIFVALGGTAQKEAFVGIAMEAASSGDLIEVQVAGLCEIAILLDTGDLVGELVGLHTVAGQLTEVVERDSLGNLQLVCGVIAVEGTAATADNSVWLLNPLNY